MKQGTLLRAVIAAVTFIIPIVSLAESYPEPSEHPQEYLRWFVQKCFGENGQTLKQKRGLSDEQIGAYCGCAAGSALLLSLIKAKSLDPKGEVTGGAPLIDCVKGLAAPGAPKLQP